MGEPVWPPKSSSFSFSYKSPQPEFSFKPSTSDDPLKTNIFQQSTAKETEAFNPPFNLTFPPSWLGPNFSFNAPINAKSCDPNTKSGPGEHAQKTTGVATNTNIEKNTGAFVLENKKNGALGVGVLDPVDAAHKTTEIATDMEMKKKLETEIAANMKMVYKKNLGCSADDAQKTTEAATKKKVEAAMLENEKNVENVVGVLDPVDDDKRDKKAREARQSPPANSVVVVSRILKGMPQSPHFYQLRDHSECSKTCLKSSWDRIFEDTAEQIQSLQANDFWVRARELWKTMGELQIMGYNVIPLRRRLVELTDVMMEQKLAKSKVKGLKIKAENHRMEKSRLEFVIQHLQEMIRKELQGMDRSLAQAIEMEKDMFKFDDVFAKLAMEPL